MESEDEFDLVVDGVENRGGKGGEGQESDVESDVDIMTMR